MAVLETRRRFLEDVMSHYRQNTCEDHGDSVVVYVGSSCPACVLQQERDGFEEEKIDLEKRVDNLESDVADLESQVADLESQVADYTKEQRTINKTRAAAKTGRRFIKDYKYAQIR